MKFHWKPKLGLTIGAWNEAMKINGADPDFHRRYLWDSIEAEIFPEWSLAFSCSTPDTAARLPSTCSILRS